jgi:ankyrin repeat protein
MADYSTMTSNELLLRVFLFFQEEELIYHPIVRQRIREIINTPIEDYGGVTLLHEFCAAGYLEGVQILLEEGADPNIIDNYKRMNSIDWVFENSNRDVSFRRKEIVKLLIEYGVDLYKKNRGENGLSSYDLLSRENCLDLLCSDLDIKEPICK